MNGWLMFFISSLISIGPVPSSIPTIWLPYCVKTLISMSRLSAASIHGCSNSIAVWRFPFRFSRSRAWLTSRVPCVSHACCARAAISFMSIVSRMHSWPWWHVASARTATLEWLWACMACMSLSVAICTPSCTSPSTVLCSRPRWRVRLLSARRASSILDMIFEHMKWRDEALYLVVRCEQWQWQINLEILAGLYI